MDADLAQMEQTIKMLLQRGKTASKNMEQERRIQQAKKREEVEELRRTVAANLKFLPAEMRPKKEEEEVDKEQEKEQEEELFLEQETIKQKEPVVKKKATFIKEAQVAYYTAGPLMNLNTGLLEEFDIQFKEASSGSSMVSSMSSLPLSDLSSLTSPSVNSLNSEPLTSAILSIPPKTCPSYLLNPPNATPSDSDSSMENQFRMSFDMDPRTFKNLPINRTKILDSTYEVGQPGDWEQRHMKIHVTRLPDNSVDFLLIFHDEDDKPTMDMSINMDKYGNQKNVKMDRLPMTKM